ncbi:MAG: hypothetical protein OHK0031_07780 [Anaerolineales bacterium]
MMDKEKLRQRFLRDALPLRLGGLSATCARISSSARESLPPQVICQLLDEARYFIEWTAAEAEPEIAAELVQMQRLMTLWRTSWPQSGLQKSQRVLLAAQAKDWSDKALQFSGLLS